MGQFSFFSELCTISCSVWKETPKVHEVQHGNTAEPLIIIIIRIRIRTGTGTGTGTGIGTRTRTRIRIM